MTVTSLLIDMAVNTPFLRRITKLQNSLVAQMVKSLPAMWESRVWSLSWEDPLEKAMATQSSILAWRIPWIEEPGGLQSMGSKRVGHDWTTNAFTFFMAGNTPFLRRITKLQNSLVAQMVKSLPAMWETQIWSLSWEDPLEKEMATNPVFLPRKCHGQREEPGGLYSPRGCRRVGHNLATEQHQKFSNPTSKWLSQKP